MKIITKNFGEVDYTEDRMINFKEGVPGFREVKRYIIIEDSESPLKYLQAIDEDISFIMINPYLLMEDYTVEIHDRYVEELGGGSVEQFNIYVIATVVENFETATVNLIAPVIIQTETRQGMQVILENTNYTTRHKIVDLLREGGK